MGEFSINPMDEDYIVTMSGNNPTIRDVNKIELTLSGDKQGTIPILKIKNPFIPRGRKGFICAQAQTNFPRYHLCLSTF